MGAALTSAGGNLGMGIVWGGGADWEEGGGVWVQGLDGGCGEVVGGRAGGFIYFVL